MKSRHIVFAVAVVFAMISAGAAHAATQPLVTVPITGTFTDALGGVGHFLGNLNITGISNVNNTLTATGTVVGTLTNSAGTVLGSVLQTVSIPLTASGTCQILNLQLGPLDLNLLGLTVHLNQVVLDIAAQSGAGNLLGNLLCAVSHLLDQSNLTAVANLLNQVLGAL